MNRFSPEPPDAVADPLLVTRRTSLSRTRNLVTAALIVSLLAVSAWVTIPMGTVPVTLQVFVVVLAALLLSPGWAAASLGAYVFMGAAGLPVFSHGTGGLGVMVGPTGGYILGFLLAAPLGAALRQMLQGRHFSTLVCDVSAAVTCIVCIYLLGWMQLAVVTRMGIVPALLVGVVPFLIADAIKAAVAISVATAVRRARAQTPR